MKRSSLLAEIYDTIEDVLYEANGSLTYEELSDESSKKVLQLVEKYMIPKDTIELEHLKCRDNGWEDES